MSRDSFKKIDDQDLRKISAAIIFTCLKDCLALEIEKRKNNSRFSEKAMEGRKHIQDLESHHHTIFDVWLGIFGWERCDFYRALKIFLEKYDKKEIIIN